MKNLEKLEVAPLTNDEMQNINGGGIIRLLSKLIVGAWEWLVGEAADFVDGFQEGYEDAQVK
jgi:bacteriocin-like protein